MASKTEKITALEERVTELEALLADPVSLLTEALKTADAAALKSFLAVMQGAIAEHVPETAPAAKAKKEKKPTTNKEGPSAWNAEVKEVETALLAEGKTRVKKKTEELGEDEFNYDFLLKEASVRKMMREESIGREEAEVKAAEKTAAKEKKAKKASDSGSVSSKSSGKSAKSLAAGAAAAPKPAKEPKKEKKSKEDEATKRAKKLGATAETLAELAEMDIFPQLVEDELYYIDKSNGETYAVNEDGSLDERVGVFNADSGEVEMD
jgi:hypothetical protein